MKSSFDGRLIGFLSSLVSDFEEAVPARLVNLKREEVIRLKKSSGIKTIEIKSGSVWLTGTPANGDLILQHGARFETSGEWPYIIQALEPAEIALLLTRHS
jgi:hypothetical protein